MAPERATLPAGLCICRNPLCAVPYGLCHCGCGGQTSIAKRSDAGKGSVIGLPRRYAFQHGAVEYRPMVVFEIIDGVPCARIPLTKEQSTVLFASDYSLVQGKRWYAQWDKERQCFYAARNGPRVNGRHRTIYMHREILGLDMEDPRQGDHIETSRTLDNRTTNLRLASPSNNSMNMAPTRRNTSGVKGVSQLPNGMWCSRICAHRKRVELGHYATFDEAVSARKRGEQQYHGEFAYSVNNRRTEGMEG